MYDLIYLYYFCLKLFKCPGGASIELEKSLAEGAGLTGGHTSPELEEAKQRVRLEEIKLKESLWSR